MGRADRAALYILLAGVGVAMLAAASPLALPDLPKIVWQIILCLGGILAVIPALFLVYEYRDVARSGRVIPLIGMLVCGLGFIACAAWYFWPMAERNSTKQPQAAQTQEPSVPDSTAPTFDVADNAQITVHSLNIKGPAPSSVAKATGSGKLTIGSMTTISGAIELPDPPASLENLTNSELRASANLLVQRLRLLRAEYDAAAKQVQDMSPPRRADGASPEDIGNFVKEIGEKTSQNQQRFNARFAESALRSESVSLAAAMVSRAGHPIGMPKKDMTNYKTFKRARNVQIGMMGLLSESGGTETEKIARLH
jgi:hypothetical protein